VQCSSILDEHLWYDSQARPITITTLQGGVPITVTMGYNADGQRARYTVTMSGTATLDERFQYQGGQLAQMAAMTATLTGGGAIQRTGAYTDSYVYGANDAPLELLRQRGSATNRYWAIFAQRPEKVKVRIERSSSPLCPLRRVGHYGGSGVRKVSFLHSASTWPHLVKVSPGIRADTVAKIIMRIVRRGAGFLHSTVIAQDEGQEAHPLGAFYLFGALGKNSHHVVDAVELTLRTGVGVFVQ